jgi:hypothetical protein
LRDAAAFEPDLRARNAGPRQRRFRNVEREEPAAAWRKSRGQHADTAADFQRIVEGLLRQRSQCRRVFLGFIRAAGETPRVRVSGVKRIEIIWRDCLGAPAQDGTSR